PPCALCPPPRPPSFPTRRSSDLSANRLVDGAELLDRERVGDELERDAATVEVGARARDRRLEDLGVVEREALGRKLRHREPSRADRKSTRLNSSHQIISYAVFCL